MVLTRVAWRVRGSDWLDGLGRKLAAVKAAWRAVAKGWRGYGDDEEEGGRGMAWREEVRVGGRKLWRRRRFVRGGGGGASLTIGVSVGSGGIMAAEGGGAESVMLLLLTSPTGGGLEAERSMSCISKLFRNLHASSTRSGVVRLMTPMVKWMDPMGRIALAGRTRAASPDSLFFGAVTSAAKREIEDWSCGREADVARGRSRKCVSWGFAFGGMIESEKKENAAIS